nr:hypothetical protein [Methylobacterium terricola]
MSRRIFPVLAVLAAVVPAAPALAQSVGAPAGSDPATAPGGTEGIAGPRNEAEAIRSGDVVPVPPNRAIAVDETRLPVERPVPSPVRR